jgi:two-component system, response regulator PdtaR
VTDERLAILIAEDEPLASMALRAQVEALGHTVLAVARDGADAAALTRCLPADLAIFDMKMPAMSGLDAALDAFPEAPTPVLLLTGFATADLPDPIPEPPIFALVSKPVGLDDIRRGIRRANDAFSRWRDQGSNDDRVRESREERRAIASALQGLDQPLTAAATRLLQRARAEDALPLDLARRLLQERDAD